ncbi:phage tail protein [uncultured Prevotella sp.]|uniref:phage tail protein n=1 Tax=uncultured Prevotella sp. TaxID=159272 RepID=UPI0025D6E5EA|nr:phage tail protein [uncultured Prevotella sp.]
MGITQITKRNGETIQLNTNEPFCFVKEATLTSSLMGDDYISLKIVSANWLSFAKGDKITVGGKEYSIRATTTREVVSEGYYNYEPVFYGVMYDLMKTIYRNCDKYGKSDKSTFDLTYTIKEFVQVLIYNMERDYPGLWKFDVDNCPDTEAKTIQFSGVNCLQALQTICNSEQFNLEFQITQDKGVRTIHIGKFGKRINPPSGADFFEWGKGNGLYNLKEQKIDDKAIITRLWAEGGTTNIRSDYRGYAERLQLPMQRMNQYDHTLADGTIVKANSEMIGISDESKRYIENEELRDKIGSEEDVKTYDNIYPKRTGKVTAVVADDICAFVDDTMDFDLNKKNDKGTVYLVDGVSAKITFTSGRLAGQQFELNAKGGYDDKTKTFKIIPFTDSRGLTIPSAETQDAYKIEVGNTYKITDIYLPEQYEKRAEEDLWYAGSDDFKDASQVKAQYALTFDRLYFLQSLSRDTETSVFEVGDYVPVKDTRFGIEKTMRIQKITRNLLLEHDYQITLADSTAISIQTQTVLTVIDHENVINNNRLRDLNKARRGWRTTEDLRNMVYDTDGYFDTENIKPNSIDTNMLTVGAKSQQFVLSGCVLKANFGGNPNMFVATAGILSHLTIDNDKIRSWQMNEASFELQSTGGYYLFAKCSKSGENGVWYLTQEQLKFEPTSDPSNYYFQVGIISSLYSDDNFRDFQTTYGFTRINGNTITTGRIITSDGECFLDLDGNKFRIGDSTSSIDWNVSAKSRLTLKNVSVASVSGDVVPLGVYRGVWNKDYIYYYGDEVSYTDNSGATCTYRYNHATPSKGIVPTNTVYWGIVAQGANGKDGENGKSPSMVYRGVYDSSKTYYGNQYRVDAVKYNGIYYVARIDAGEFYNVAPTNTSKWNNFGAQFESVATELLLAENANIANFIFRNQRMESQGSTSGISNIILDGLNNIASFAAGKVVFDKGNAKLGWLQIVDNDLVGLDNNGEERIRISNKSLPSVNTLAKYEYLSCTYEGYPNDAVFDEQSLELSRKGYREEIHDEWSGDTINEDTQIWIDIIFSVDENDTVIDFDYQYAASPQKGLSSVDRSIIVKNTTTNLTVASSNTSELTTKLSIGTYKASYYVRFNFNDNWKGSMYISFRPPQIRKWAQQTYIGRDGVLVTSGGNYFQFKPNLYEVSIGNNGIKCTNEVLQKKVKGSWVNL